MRGRPPCENFAVQNCKDIQLCGCSQPDGEYWLYTGRVTRVKIYCHNMDTTNPKGYITLPENYSTWPPVTMTGQSDCSTFVDWTWKTPGTTFLNKILINVKKMTVVHDLLHANTTGNPQELGAFEFIPSTKNCKNLGVMKIDTRGTGLVVGKTMEVLGPDSVAELPRSPT